MAEEETNEIPIERAHRLGNIREDSKPRLRSLLNFSFHKDKERILERLSMTFTANGKWQK